VQLRAAAAVLLATLLAAAPGHATPDQELNNARTQFRAGNFPATISLLSTLLYPNNKLSDKEQIAQAHLLLGVAYLETGNRAGAEQEFEEALFNDVTLSLDPLLYSEQAISTFEDKKKRVLERIEREQERARLAQERAAFDELVKNALVVEKRDYWVNFLPFGFGQFQNGDTTKGTVLAIGQAAFAGTSLALFSYQVITYGYRGPNVPVEDRDLVNKIQVAQVGAFIGFAAVWGYGIVDSLGNYEPTTQRVIINDPKLLKQLRENQKNESDKKPRKKSSLQIVPAPIPKGMGVGVSWEF